MTSSLADVATLVRSKNAGPFWLTIDIFCASSGNYERVAASPVTDPHTIAAIYGIPASSVRIFGLPDLHAIKISFARPVIQGSTTDRDMHAGQQYVPLLGIRVPDRLQPEVSADHQKAPKGAPIGMPE